MAKKLLLFGITMTAALLAACAPKNTQEVYSWNDSLSGGQVAGLASQYCGNPSKMPNPNLWYMSGHVTEEIKGDQHKFVLFADQYDDMTYKCSSEWMPWQPPTATPEATATPEISFLAKLAHPDLPESESGAYVFRTEGGTFGVSEKDLYDLINGSSFHTFDRISSYKIPDKDSGKYSHLEEGILHVFDNPVQNSEISDGVSNYDLVVGYFNSAGPFQPDSNRPVSQWTFYTSKGEIVAVQYRTPSGGPVQENLDWIMSHAVDPSTPVVLVGKYDPNSSFNVFEAYGILEESTLTSYKPANSQFSLASADPIAKKEANDKMLATLRNKGIRADKSYVARQARNMGYTPRGHI